MKESKTKISGKGLQSETYFEVVYKRYFDRLFAYALIITKSESSAKDVVADVFYGLWKSKKDLVTIKELKSYLYTSVKNQAIRTISSDLSRFNNNNYNLTIITIDEVDPEELLLGKELDQFIHKIVNELPSQCQLVYKMIKEDSLSYQETAQELGISIDTVKHHLKSAIKKLRFELENHFSESQVARWMS